MKNYTKNVGIFLLSVSLATTIGSTAFIAYIGITDRMNDTQYVHL